MARRLGFARLRQTHLPERPSMGRIFASAVAGISGAATHWLLMMSKQQLRLFPEFQPYESFQRLLISLLGSELHPTAAWAISLVSGGTIIGFLYAQTYSALPFRNGIGKGLAFAVIAWIILNLALFPAIGLGYFAMRTSAGLGASAFSLVMVSIYGMVMGGTYAVLLKYSNRTS